MKQNAVRCTQKSCLRGERKQGAGFRLTNSVPFGYLRRNGESNMIKDEEVAPYLSEAFSDMSPARKCVILQSG